MENIKVSILGDEGYVCQIHRIKEGMKADITIFNQNTIIDKSTFDFPHQYPEGIYYVIVNGQLAIDNEEFKNIKAGNILRKNAVFE